jgi:hypothetical protein
MESHARPAYKHAHETQEGLAYRETKGKAFDTDTQRNRSTNNRRSWQTDRQAGRQANRQTHKEAGRQIDRRTFLSAVSQIDRQEDRCEDSQADGCKDRFTVEQTTRWIQIQTD